MATTGAASQVAAHVDPTPDTHLEHVAWKLAFDADTYGVTAGEATP